MKATPPLLLLAEGRRARARKGGRNSPLEITLHMCVADVLRKYAQPEWLWGHYPAGELRNVRTAAKLKAMGVQRGWPDVLLFSPAGLLHAIELKRLGEDLNDDQEVFQRWCIQNGVRHSVVRTIDEALQVLDAWGCLRIRIGGAP